MPEGAGRKIAIGGVLVLAIGAAVLTARGSAELPEPLLTEDALPALPPPEQNGWHAIETLPQTVELDAGDATAAVLEVENDEMPAEARWQALVDRKAELHAAFERSDIRDALSHWHDASAAPSFVDGCRRPLDVACPHLLFYKLGRVAMIEVAAAAVDGDMARAYRLLVEAIALGRGMLTTNRGTLAAVVGASSLASNLAMADLLLAVDATDEMTEPKRALITAVHDLGDVVMDGEDALGRVLIGNYLWQRRGLEQVREHGIGVLAGGSWWQGLTYDAERTERLLQDLYVELSGGTVDDTDAQGLVTCSWSRCNSRGNSTSAAAGTCAS